LESKSKLILSTFITIIAVLILLVALPNPTTIIHHLQQQEALAQINDTFFKTYQNATSGIQIQYPSNWTIDESDIDSDDNLTDIVSFFAPVRNDLETDGPSFYISYISIDNPLSSNLSKNLDEYLTTTINDYNDTQDFKVIESNTNSILADKPAYKLVFTDVDDDNNYYKSMEIGTIIGDKIYFVTYDAEGEEEQYSNYLPTVQKMIDSLNITTSDN
jgi:hypothetical protein